MKVLKFGGTSMGSEDSLRQVASIIRQNYEDEQVPVIVCSAMSGVTNLLLEMGDLAEKGSMPAIDSLLKQIETKHLEMAAVFEITEEVEAAIRPLLEDLHGFVQGIARIRELSDRSLAYLASLGERLSTRLLAEILKQEGLPGIQQDTKFIRTTGGSYKCGEVDWDQTKLDLLQALNPLLEQKQIPVLTGFFGTNPQSIISLLGWRGGSDYSAAIVAVSLDCPTLEIWTDVDGFLSADPRIVPEAHVISHISYEEATELCFFGAKVLHPRTIRPVIEGGGEVCIKNTFEPEKQGTRITKVHEEKCQTLMLSVASKPVVMISLDLFGSLKSQRIVYKELFDLASGCEARMDLIASSESIFTFCMSAEDMGKNGFLEALENIAPLQIEEDKSIICIVSPRSVHGQAGVSAQIFQAVAKENVSISAFSQNASEIAQLLVLDTPKVQDAIRSLHTSLTQHCPCEQ